MLYQVLGNVGKRWISRTLRSHLDLNLSHDALVVWERSHHPTESVVTLGDFAEVSEKADVAFLNVGFSLGGGVVGERDQIVETLGSPQIPPGVLELPDVGCASAEIVGLFLVQSVVNRARTGPT